MLLKSFMHDLHDYYTLCKPKVVAVMLVTSIIGMLLAYPSSHQAYTSYPLHTLATLHTSHPLQSSLALQLISWQALQAFLFGTLGIALAAASAAVINHLVDSSIDAKMSRTSQRPIASGRISGKNAVIFATFLGICGLIILSLFVNVLTAVLSFLTLLGYAVIYTMFLKRATPQNIVIGGAAGAMPPLLGWAAVSNEIHAHALLLVLIIFIWTPPHFWALAIYRNEDYKNANIPMLPVTHGIPFTITCIILYTILLIAITLLPFITAMSGILYLISACILGLLFLLQCIRLYFSYKQCLKLKINDLNLDITRSGDWRKFKQTAFKTFSFSILYLLLLFAALLIDHYYSFNM